MISIEQIRQAIETVAAVDGVEFDADMLVDDALVLAYAFTDAEEYAAAIQATARALELLAAGRVAASQLDEDYEGWRSYHYQHRVAQGAKADMRIMFRSAGNAIQVRGFGHRRMPADFYRRMSEIGRAR